MVPTTSSSTLGGEGHVMGVIGDVMARAVAAPGIAVVDEVAGSLNLLARLDKMDGDVLLSAANLHLPQPKGSDRSQVLIARLQNVRFLLAIPFEKPR
ncbi:hypothetical protein KOF26_07215 [Sphingomonas sp. XMGL2]|uniref:Uncharacterized protein n=1 Tax=Sphingomonas quercus TaxID=2842451 RepID=A0ABS6BH76_9SPHN|nr:hypothetical protein [Sphingomonas quercus]